MVKIYKPVKPLRSSSQGMLVVLWTAATLWNDLHSTDLKKVVSLFSIHAVSIVS